MSIVIVQHDPQEHFFKTARKKYRDMLSGTYCKDNMEVKKVKDMLLRTFKTYGS